RRLDSISKARGGRRLFAQVEQFRSLREGEPALRKPLERVLLRCSIEPLPQGGGLVGVLLVAAQLRQLRDAIGDTECIRTIGHTFTSSIATARTILHTSTRSTQRAPLSVRFPPEALQVRRVPVPLECRLALR